MLVQEHRKVNEIGSGGHSLVMRLPKAWATAVGIGDGSEVLVAFGFGDVLLVAAAGREAEIARLVAAARWPP